MFIKSIQQGWNLLSRIDFVLHQIHPRSSRAMNPLAGRMFWSLLLWVINGVVRTRLIKMTFPPESQAVTACTSCIRQCRNGLRKLSAGRFQLSRYLMLRWGMNGVASISAWFAPSKSRMSSFRVSYHLEISSLDLGNQDKKKDLDEKSIQIWNQ